MKDELRELEVRQILFNKLFFVCPWLRPSTVAGAIDNGPLLPHLCAFFRFHFYFFCSQWTESHFKIDQLSVCDSPPLRSRNREGFESHTRGHTSLKSPFGGIFLFVCFLAFFLDETQFWCSDIEMQMQRFGIPKLPLTFRVSRRRGMHFYLNHPMFSNDCREYTRGRPCVSPEA